MNRIVHLLQLRMLPPGINLGLLVLRLGLGLSLLWLHGWGKLTGFTTMAPGFADPWGIGSGTTLGLVVFAEFFCAALVVLGLFTRFAALVSMIGMAGAFWYGHGARLTGEGNGELAFLYLVGFFVLLLTGPGRYALDNRFHRPATTAVR